MIVSVEMVTAHRCTAAVSRPVVEGGIAVDLAVCIPVKVAGYASAASKQLPGRDAGPAEFNGMLGHSGIGLMGWKWCNEGHGSMMGVRFHRYSWQDVGASTP